MPLSPERFGRIARGVARTHALSTRRTAGPLRLFGRPLREELPRAALTQGRLVEPRAQLRDRLEHRQCARVPQLIVTESAGPDRKRPDARLLAARTSHGVSPTMTASSGDAPPARSSAALTRSGCGLVDATSAELVHASASSRAPSRSR